MTASHSFAEPQQTLQSLKRLYPELKTELKHTNLYQLFVSVLLSAQCTDKRVNLITPEFFRAYPDFTTLALGHTEEVESFIRSCGLFRAKARNLVASARQIQDRFQGELPRHRKDLESLPGIGRKSASVILIAGMDTPAFPVDTHVGRLSRRLGWSRSQDPAQIERDVISLFPERDWNELHHALILHGRRLCGARRPKCEECALASLCPKILS